MAIANLIARGIGFSPGSVKFVVTLGLSLSIAATSITSTADAVLQGPVPKTTVLDAALQGPVLKTAGLDAALKHTDIPETAGLDASIYRPTFSIVNNYGGVHVTASAAAITWTGQAAVSAGNGFVVAIVGCDNMSTGELSTNYITGVTFAGNAARKIGEWTNANAASLAGAVVAAFIYEPAVNLAVSALAIASFAPQASRGTANSFYVWKNAASTITFTAVQARSFDNTSIGPITIDSLASQPYFFVAGIAGEETAGSSFVETTNYATAGTRQGGGGTSGSAMGVRSAYRLLTGTADTYDPSTQANDYAALFFALYETAVVTTTTLTASLDATMQGSPTKTASIDAKLLTSVSMTTLMSAIISHQFPLTASADAILLHTQTLLASIDAKIFGSPSKTSLIDAKVLHSLPLTTLVDALLLKSMSVAAQIDAEIIAFQGESLLGTIDAILKHLDLQSFATIDAKLLGTISRTAGIDATLTMTAQIMTFIDAVFSRQKMTQVRIDALVGDYWRPVVPVES